MTSHTMSRGNHCAALGCSSNYSMEISFSCTNMQQASLAAVCTSYELFWLHQFTLNEEQRCLQIARVNGKIFYVITWREN